MTNNQYAERDIMDLDISGNHYSRHISAMTREGLHSKSDIAAELAWRDARIAELETRTVKLPKPHTHLIWIQAGHAPDGFWDYVTVSHSEKDRSCDGSERYPVYARWDIEEVLKAAGIKLESE
ncbi:hypothetical protein GCM10009414_29010 [Tatumella terrea]|uniref:hypothetical protein n=1 Tax=Tatumella terrea TaxID=419007 RepID=UPI0031E0A6B3